MHRYDFPIFRYTFFRHFHDFRNILYRNIFGVNAIFLFRPYYENTKAYRCIFVWLAWSDSLLKSADLIKIVGTHAIFLRIIPSQFLLLSVHSSIFQFRVFVRISKLWFMYMEKISRFIIIAFFKLKILRRVFRGQPTYSVVSIKISHLFM